MSVIIIALSGMPCADGAPSFNKSPQTVQSDSNSHTNHDNDACSPFCVCNCCTGIGFFEVKQPASADIFVSALIEKQLPQYTSTLFANFQHSIWQPPKIS
nr:DUF6660 family protein [Flavobacterium sp.]